MAGQIGFARTNKPEMDRDRSTETLPTYATCWGKGVGWEGAGESDFTYVLEKYGEININTNFIAL